MDQNMPLTWCHTGEISLEISSFVRLILSENILLLAVTHTTVCFCC